MLAEIKKDQCRADRLGDGPSTKHTRKQYAKIYLEVCSLEVGNMVSWQRAKEAVEKMQWKSPKVLECRRVACRTAD